jgi:MFS family permease
MIGGYLLGGTIAAYSPRSAVLFDAVTFGASACIVGLGIRYREPGLRRERRTHLLREAAEGFEVVFGRKVLRSIAVVTFTSLLFAVVPEGLGAAWAAHLTDNLHDRGWTQGVIMCSMPTGFVLGSILINRFVRPNLRQRLIRQFAILAPLALIPAVFDLPLYGVAIITAVSGFAVAALLPAANGLFVQALPNEYRARAFGVMQTGIQLSQGAAVFATGALASRLQLPLVVGVWGVGGVLLMLVATLTWPRQEAVADEIDRAQRANAADDQPRVGGPPAPGQSTGVQRRSGDGAVRSADGSSARNGKRSRHDDDDDPPRSGGGRHRLRTASR